VRSRFADAEFFLREDKKKTLLERREDLKTVAFLKDLGTGASIHAKTLRVEGLTTALAGKLGWSADKTKTAAQIAALAKNDLTTQMVGEFPELQGTVGTYYAQAEGLDATVAQGIADHYRPKNAEDGYPATEEGALVGLADRLDTLVGLFGKGKIPTGSADPFALRRACWTAIALILHGNIRVTLTELLGAALAQYSPAEITPAERDGLVEKLRDFFRDRARNLFAETGRPGLPGGIVPDTFEAAVAAEAAWENLPELVSRLLALQEYRARAEFAQLSETFKRLSNILKDVHGEPLAPEKLVHPSEQALYQAYLSAKVDADDAVANRNWSKALGAIAGLNPPITKLFADVMVNDPDVEVRKQRQALLRDILFTVRRVADFSAFQG